jgi:hypothetical protein
MKGYRLFLLPVIMYLAACAGAPSAAEELTSSQVTQEPQPILTPQSLALTTPSGDQPGSIPTFDFVLRFTPAPTETSAPPLEPPAIEAGIPTTLLWEGRPTYLAESQPDYYFRILFDPEVWGLVKDYSGIAVLGHRDIAYCIISPAISRGLPLNTVVEHETRKLGSIPYNVNTVYANGQKQFVTFVGGDGLIFTGFDVNFKERTDDCLSDAEQVLGTLRSIPQSQVTADP